MRTSRRSTRIEIVDKGRHCEKSLVSDLPGSSCALITPTSRWLWWALYGLLWLSLSHHGTMYVRYDEAVCIYLVLLGISSFGFCLVGLIPMKEKGVSWYLNGIMPCFMFSKVVSLNFVVSIFLWNNYRWKFAIKVEKQLTSNHIMGRRWPCWHVARSWRKEDAQPNT